MLPLLGIAGGVLGGLAGLFNKEPQMVRREEQYNRDAASMIRDAAARNNQINAAATSRAQQQAISATQQAAIDAAANATAGQMATSGDYANPVGRGIAMAGQTQAAAAPYSQQIAQAIGNADQTRMQQAQLGNSLASNLASLSNNVTYERTPQQNTLLNILSGIQGGANSASNIWSLLNMGNKPV